MKILSIHKTKITPEVLFDKNGKFRMEGRSIPEDPESFYTPIIEWLLQYFKSPEPESIFDIQLEYINSGSTKFVLALLKIMKLNHEKGHKCIINWIYEEDDENLQELGIHYKSILQMPFNLVEIL